MFKIIKVHSPIYLAYAVLANVFVCLKIDVNEAHGSTSRQFM